MAAKTWCGHVLTSIYPQARLLLKGANFVGGQVLFRHYLFMFDSVILVANGLGVEKYLFILKFEKIVNFLSTFAIYKQMGKELFRMAIENELLITNQAKVPE